MKTVSITWLRERHPTPSLVYCSEKYQYYICPTSEENPYNCPYIMVKARKSYIQNSLKKIYPQENEETT